MRTILTKMAILVIALAMVVGVAAAAPSQMRIEPQDATIPYDPDFVTYTVDVYDIYEPDIERRVIVTVDNCPGGDPMDLRFMFTNRSDTGVSSPWLSHGDTWNWGKPQGSHPTSGYGYENLTMKVKAVSGPEGTKYLINLTDRSFSPSEYGDHDTADGTTWATSIPEFATIAIPVATILGLLFFFNHRKRRKE